MHPRRPSMALLLSICLSLLCAPPRCPPPLLTLHELTPICRDIPQNRRREEAVDGATTARFVATEIYHVISLGEEKRSEEEVEEEVADLWENPKIHIFEFGTHLNVHMVFPEDVILVAWILSECYSISYMLLLRKIIEYEENNMTLVCP
nr:uncharacterized protein LOC127338380 [Lolium perenne]